VKTVGVAVALLLGLSLLPRAGAVESSSTVHVAFLRGEQLALVRRVGVDPADALRGLVAGLTRAERAAGYRTYLPSGTRLLRLTVEHGTATADLNRRFVCTARARRRPARTRRRRRTAAGTELR